VANGHTRTSRRLRRLKDTAEAVVIRVNDHAEAPHYVAFVRDDPLKVGPVYTYWTNAPTESYAIAFDDEGPSEAWSVADVIGSLVRVAGHEPGSQTGSQTPLDRCTPA
jgi:hypothetical protein